MNALASEIRGHFAHTHTLTPSAEEVLHQRRRAFAVRRQHLLAANAVILSPALTWPAFWDRVNPLLRDCGYAKSTRRQFRHVLRGLRRAGMHSPSAVSRAAVRAYVHNLAASGASWSWIALNIGVLRTVFDRLCNLSVAAGLVTPKRGCRLPEILSEREARQLLHAAGTIRDQLLLGLLYGCGLSGREACNLRWRDALDSGAKLHIEATTRYMERIQPVPEAFRQLLRMGAQTCDPAAHIFPGRQGDKPLSQRTVQTIVRRARERAGLHRPVSVMGLRHSYAVRRIENGIGLRQLQHELGLVSIRSVERYRRCLVPSLETHPFSKVRALITAQCPSSDTLEPSATIPHDSSSAPLQGLVSIDLRGIQLPFAPEGQTPAQRFAAFLKSRLLCGILRRPAARAP